MLSESNCLNSQGLSDINRNGQTPDWKSQVYEAVPNLKKALNQSSIGTESSTRIIWLKKEDLITVMEIVPREEWAESKEVFIAFYRSTEIRKHANTFCKKFPLLQADELVLNTWLSLKEGIAQKLDSHKNIYRLSYGFMNNTAYNLSDRHAGKYVSLYFSDGKGLEGQENYTLEELGMDTVEDAESSYTEIELENLRKANLARMQAIMSGGFKLPDYILRPDEYIKLGRPDTVKTEREK